MLLIEINKEPLISLKDFAKKIDRKYNTVLRLVKKGARGLNGRIVRLEAIKAPAGLRTSEKAWERFLRELNRV